MGRGTGLDGPRYLTYITEVIVTLHTYSIGLSLWSSRRRRQSNCMNDQYFYKKYTAKSVLSLGTKSYEFLIPQYE
jgi:hypothetical protein